MEKRLETVSVMQDILRDASTGLWCIELDPEKPPRLYADSTFREMMAMDASLTPEEGYRFWLDRVAPEDLPRVQASVEDMTRFLHAEALYAWNHPQRGTVYIRCGGRRDPDYPEGVRLRGSHQDVSELARVRIEMQRRLEQHQQEFARLARASEADRTILNALPGGVAVIRHEPGGRSVPEFLSEGFAAMTGMTPEEAWALYCQDAMNGVHPDDREKLSRSLDTYFRGSQENTELTYRLLRADGSYFWVRNSLTMVREDAGFKRVYCVYRDITKELEERENLRRQYEERLAQHYRTVGADNLAAGHSNITRSQVLELIDHTPSLAFSSLGREREAFVRGVSALIPDPGEARSFREALGNAALLTLYARGKREFSHACFLRLSPDQPGRYVEFRLALLSDPDSGDVMSFLRVTDVTEQTVTRKILRKQSSLGCDMVMDVDLYRDTVSVLSIHGPETTSTGWGGYSSRVQAALDRVVPRDRDMVREKLSSGHILRELSDNESYSFLYSLTGGEGDLRTKRMTVSAIDLRLGRVCLSRSDMTEALEAERRNRAVLEKALADAEAANRAKSDFLSSMSHDIRTPMNAITGMTMLAKAHLDDREKVAECLENISLSSSHLLSLINDILDMNKLDCSRLTLHREEITVCAILRQMQSMFSAPAAEKGLSFRVERQALTGRSFYADPLRLNQILINLLGNAVKFTPVGGSVTLLARELPAGEGRVRWSFTVTDTGIGISPEFLPRVYDPFSRGERSDSIEGTGLGLAIVKGLVELMEGTITLDTREGEGTSFRLELEFNAAGDDASLCEETPEPNAPDSPPLEGLRLLAAEDNALNAEILEELLKMNGAGVALFENGALALDAFRQSPPGTYDAVLLDIQMPVMNGYDTARAIRRLPNGASVPIIAMTANAFTEDVQAALDAGMDAHTSKPIDMERLVRLLKETIRQKKA